jgi:hypothetical protein
MEPKNHTSTHTFLCPTTKQTTNTHLHSAKLPHIHESSKKSAIKALSIRKETKTSMPRKKSPKPPATRSMLDDHMAIVAKVMTKESR